MPSYKAIALPTRPQPDTIVAIFILKRFGREMFPGIEDAGVTIIPRLGEGENDESMAAKGVLLMDVGGGKLDHHNAPERTTASKLVAQLLGVAGDPALQKLLAYAERDDFYGKGIVSSDPLDRAFGLSGLIANLNRSHPDDPELVVRTALPLIEAHYEEEWRRTEGLPKEFEEKLSKGEAKTFTVKQQDKNLSVVVLSSDNPGLPGYLRSQNGGRFDVVAQWLSSGHLNILTRPVKKVDLRSLAALLRMEECNKKKYDLELTAAELSSTGRINSIPEWYFDPATNSIQNGGLNPKDVPSTGISKEEAPALIAKGLEGSIWDAET